MDAAEDEFLRVRLDGAVMESIAAAAGVSKTTLYGRYPSKEALFRALLEERIEAWSQENRRYDYLLSDDLHERLRSHARVLVLAMGSERSRRLEQLVESGSDGFPEFARVVHETTIGYMLRYLAGEIASRPEQARALGKDPYRIAELFVALLYGWRRLQDGFRPVSETEATSIANDAVDLIFARTSRAYDVPKS